MAPTGYILVMSHALNSLIRHPHIKIAGTYPEGKAVPELLN